MVRIDQTLAKTVAQAHSWFQDLVSGRVNNLAEIALREDIHKSDITKKLSLAFLAPDIIETIAAGKQPADLVTDQLVKRVNLPLVWGEQKHLMGFA